MSSISGLCPRRDESRLAGSVTTHVASCQTCLLRGLVAVVLGGGADQHAELVVPVEDRRAGGCAVGVDLRPCSGLPSDVVFDGAFACGQVFLMERVLRHFLDPPGLRVRRRTGWPGRNTGWC